MPRTRGRRPRHEEVRREELIRQKIAEGMTNPSEIARAVHGQSFFDSDPRSTYSCVRQFLKQNNLPAQTPNTQTLPKSDKFPTSGRKISSVENFIRQYPIKLPAGYMGEFEKFIRALRQAVIAIELQAERVPGFEQKIAEAERKIAELERHRCPDADQELKDKNARLQERITFLGKRVEALSSMTRPRQLNESHLVQSGGK